MLAFGDIIERCLRFFGITKERVQAATGKADCGCAARQAALNDWGYRLQARFGWPAHMAISYWRRLRYGMFSMHLLIAARHLYQAFRVLIFGL